MTRLSVAVLATAVVGAFGVAASPSAASVPGVNGQLGFVVNYNDEFFLLETVDPSGRSGRVLVEGELDFRAFGPARFSPSGRTIAAFLPLSRAGIWLVDALTGRPIRRIKGGRTVTAEAWSPDGRWLVYSRFRGASHLYIARANGRDARALVRGGDVGDADWSTRGRIMFRRCVRPTSAAEDVPTSCSLRTIRPEGRGE